MTTTLTKQLGASLEAVQHHYDVGNDFYRLWLDETLSYSCALWEDGDSLEAAQLRKIDYHIREAQAAGKSCVLDVGCGWGATLRRLVEKYAVEQTVGLTLSQAQADWVAGFDQPRIEVRVEAWLDHQPTTPYDAIISVGAFEHFAKPGLSAAEKIEAYRTFFQRCHTWLKPGGWMSLQSIAYGIVGPESMNQFVATRIFPESDLPTLADIDNASRGIFEIVTVRNDRLHYERTSRAWLSRLKAKRAEAIQVVGEEVVARYEKYMGLFVIGYHTGTMNLLRLTLRRCDDRPQR